MDDERLDYDSIVEILKNNYEEGERERRKRVDWVSRMATILSLCAWGIMIAVWVVLDSASPERGMLFTQSFFQVHFDTDAVSALRTRWNYPLVYAAYILMLVSLGTCAIAFIMNKMRMKRKTDKYKKSIFIVGGITIIAFVAFMIRFWSVLF